eukprot:185555_1
MNEWLFILYHIGIHHELNHFRMYHNLETTKLVIAALLYNNNKLCNVTFLIIQNVQQQQQSQQSQSSQSKINNQQQQQMNLNRNNNDKNNDDQTKENMNINSNNLSSSQQDAASILASPTNPTTVRRLSAIDPSTLSKSTKSEVSWHKRVVVHRVPRSDASRSMFHSKGKESNNSNQCCIVL